MAKGVDTRKNEKKEPTKTLKEKRLEKKAKKDKKQQIFSIDGLFNSFHKEPG